MLNKIINNLIRVSEFSTVNVERFNDPIAIKTSWSPLKKGGTNFQTHKLVTVSTSKLEFKHSFIAIFFYMIFATVGLGILGYSLYAELQLSFNLEIQNLILFGMGLLFFGIGATMAHFGTKPIVFDKMLGYYWKGRKKPNHNIEYAKPELFTHLNDIHVLQIISEYIRGEKSSYHSYELNLVFRDGSRKNVIDHGSLESLREDAQVLAQFINKLIWDNTI